MRAWSKVGAKGRTWIPKPPHLRSLLDLKGPLEFERQSRDPVHTLKKTLAVPYGNIWNGSSSKPMSRHNVPPYKCTIPSLSLILGAWSLLLLLLQYYVVNCICLGLIKVGKRFIPKCGAGLIYSPCLGPLLFWECSHRKALKPYRKVFTLHLSNMGYFALCIHLFRNQDFSSKSWFSLPIVWPSGPPHFKCVGLLQYFNIKNWIFKLETGIFKLENGIL
jgi:hypothetical protein